MKKEDVQGCWRIVSWEQVYDDGRVAYPMGEALSGFIQYDGRRVYILLTAANRPDFSTGGQWTASEAEKAAAYNTCLCYSGTYEVRDNEITHHVEVSLFPNWVGGIQKRKASFRDGRLILSGRLEAGTPEARTANLVWERA